MGVFTKHLDQPTKNIGVIYYHEGNKQSPEYYAHAKHKYELLRRI